MFVEMSPKCRNKSPQFEPSSERSESLFARTAFGWPAATGLFGAFLLLCAPSKRPRAKECARFASRLLAAMRSTQTLAFGRTGKTWERVRRNSQRRSSLSLCERRGLDRLRPLRPCKSVARTKQQQQQRRPSANALVPHAQDNNNEEAEASLRPSSQRHSNCNRT